MSEPNADPQDAFPYATVGFALKLAQQALRARLKNELRSIGLTTPQYSALRFLKAEAGASNATLARRAFVTPQTMQGILVALERSGLISRAPHPDRGRMQKFELTSKGCEVLKAATSIVLDVESSLAEGLAPVETTTMTAVLHRLAEALR